MGPIGRGRFDFFSPGTALATQSNLKNLPNMIHLRGAPDRVGIALAHAVHFIAPVEVCVDVHQMYRAAPGVGAKHRYRHAVIAADDDGHRPLFQHRAHCRFGQLVVIAEADRVADLFSVRRLQPHRPGFPVDVDHLRRSAFILVCQEGALVDAQAQLQGLHGAADRRRVHR